MSDTQHFSGILFGVPEGETWHYRVVYRPTESDIEHEQVSEDFTVTGGAPPADLPVLSPTGEGPDDLLICFPLVNGLAFVVVDGKGRYRWWNLDNVKEDTYYSLRAELALDRESFNYTLSARGFDKDSLFWKLGLDGKKERSFEVFNGSHDFVETPHGYAALILDAQEQNGSVIKGDAIVEIDADGTQTQIYSTWDDFSPENTGEKSETWSHANSLDYDAEQDRYLMGVRNFGSILAVNREGELEWGFSGDANTWNLDDSERFTSQHQYYYQGDELTVYGNRWRGEDYTAVARFLIDEETLSAQKVWSYNQQFSSNGFGSVDKIEGYYLISWGTEGNIELITEDTQEQVLWIETQESIGYASAFRYSKKGLQGYSP